MKTTAALRHLVPASMPFALFDDDNYQKTQQELAALGPQAVAIIKRYLGGAPASEIPAPMIAAAYDVLDRLGLSRNTFPVFTPDDQAAKGKRRRPRAKAR